MTTDSIDPVDDHPTPIEEYTTPPTPSEGWENKFNRKIGEANALNRFTRSVAEIISGFAASVGSIIPVITAVVVAGAFVLSGVPFILALGAATAEFVGIYIHHDYKDKALTTFGQMLYTTATFIVGLNIAAALFHIAYPTIFAEAATYGLSQETVARFATMNAFAIVVPSITAAVAIVIYLTIPLTTQENRANTRKDALVAERIDLESEGTKNGLQFDLDMAEIEANSNKQRAGIIASQEETQLQHDGALAKKRIAMNNNLAVMRIKAYESAYGEALEHQSVQAFNRKLALIDLVKQFQRDSGIHPNNKMFRDLKNELVTSLIPDMDDDGIPDIFQDLENTGPLGQRPNRQPSRNGQPV